MKASEEHVDTGVAGNANSDYTNGNNFNMKLCFGQVILTTDASVANRQLLIQLLDETGTLFIDFHAGTTVPASQTNQHFSVMQGSYRETSFIDSSLQVPIGNDLIVPPGWTVRTKITNGQAGDSYSSKMLLLQDR
jgi:hypothetical protein